ncbi:MAG: LacI family DNA-binding transcriptional regulator [Chloroflexi bacterium]|nr:LacI family DNA-binding transcriptional regulator [Chloroflexota bacterium]
MTLSRNTKDSRPTIRDVAREAGVSHQTVSRVLNEHPKVAPATRERVTRAMHKLGFERNLAAQMLTTQRSQIIQVIAVDGKFPFEIPLLNSTQGEDYFAVYSECTPKMLPRMFDMAAARMVEGVFLYAPKLQIDDDDLLKMSHNIPIVRRDFAFASKKITWVGFDQVRATHLAVHHLLDLGHREIAMVTGTLKAINASWRYATWREMLIERGIEPGPSAEGDYSTRQSALQTGYDGMCQIIQSRRRFSAVVVATDNMALGVRSALREYGLRVPEDVSLVSFDDAPHARFMDPPLTTVAMDFDLQNRLAFQFLFERISHPDIEPHPHMLLPDLVVRQSTREI